MRVVKLIFLMFAGLVLLLALSLIIFSGFYRKQVQVLVTEQINAGIQSTFTASEIRFSFLRKFPRASLEFRNVLLSVSPVYKQSATGNEINDTLLSARRLFMEISIPDMIRGKYLVNKIDIEDALVNVSVNCKGEKNFIFWKETAKREDRKETVFELKEIQLVNGEIRYNGYANKIFFRSNAKNLVITGNLLEDEKELDITLETEVTMLRIRQNHLPLPVSMTMQGKLLASDRQYRLDPSRISVAGIPADVSGLVLGPGATTDLTVKTSQADIRQWIALLPDPVKKDIKLNVSTGKVEVDGRIMKNPGERAQIRMNVVLRDGVIKMKKKCPDITNLHLKGYFASHHPGDRPGATLRLDIVSASFGGRSLSGYLTVPSSTDPALEGKLEGALLLQELADLIHIPGLGTISGEATMNLTFSLPMDGFRMPCRADLARLSANGVVRLRNVDIAAENPVLQAQSVNGNVILDDPVTLSGFSLRYGKNTINADLSIRNLFPFLSGNSTMISVSGNVQSSFITPETFPGRAAGQTRKEKDKNIALPLRLYLDLNIAAGTFQYKDLTAERVKGNLIYFPGLIQLSHFNAASMGGDISADGAAWKNADGLLTTNLQVSVKDIEIRNCFQAFNNFGQDFIMDKHLRGTTSGDLNIRCIWKEKWKIDRARLVAYSNFRIRNGELIGFEPVMSLSKYIELSELQDIRFSELQNEIYIQNEVVTIPQMEIRSNAFNIFLAGEHGMNHAIDYHLRILLSDLLARKAARAKPENTEFGIVEDDGLGRTSLYLAVTGTTDNYRVSYDKTAVKELLRERMSQEGKVLRELLREEFSPGITGDEVTTDRGDSVSRFRLQWEEKDTVRRIPPRSGDSNKPKFRLQWDDDTTVVRDTLIRK